MHGKVEISGINTAKLQVLKNDEMTLLLRRAAQGDLQARETLICGNLRLVLSVIQKPATTLMWSRACALVPTACP